MPTSWEEEVGLDPYVDDSQEDPDEDGSTNIDEYINGTNPFDGSDGPPSESCGCNGKSSVLALPLLLLLRRRDD